MVKPAIAGASIAYEKRHIMAAADAGETSNALPLLRITATCTVRSQNERNITHVRVIPITDICPWSSLKTPITDMGTISEIKDVQNNSTATSANDRLLISHVATMVGTLYSRIFRLRGGSPGEISRVASRRQFSSQYRRSPERTPPTTIVELQYAHRVIVKNCILMPNVRGLPGRPTERRLRPGLRRPGEGGKRPA